MRVFFKFICPSFIKILKKSISTVNHVFNDKEVMYEEVFTISKTFVCEYANQNKISLDEEYINISLSIALLLNKHAKANISRS